MVSPAACSAAACELLGPAIGGQVAAECMTEFSIVPRDKFLNRMRGGVEAQPFEVLVRSMERESELLGSVLTLRKDGTHVCSFKVG